MHISRICNKFSHYRCLGENITHWMYHQINSPLHKQVEIDDVRFLKEMKKETINVNLRIFFFNELSVWSEKNISVTYCPDSQPTSETSKQIPTPISLYQPPSFFVPSMRSQHM